MLDKQNMEYHRSFKSDRQTGRLIEILPLLLQNYLFLLIFTVLNVHSCLKFERLVGSAVIYIHISYNSQFNLSCFVQSVLCHFKSISQFSLSVFLQISLYFFS